VTGAWYNGDVRGREMSMVAKMEERLIDVSKEYGSSKRECRDGSGALGWSCGT
jgi:hypothetical protein